MTYTVLITGASSGIGFELAKIFASNGYNLVLASRTKTKKQPEFKDVKVTNFMIDLSQPGAAKKLYKKVKAKEINVDLLVNNAGFADYSYFEHSDINKITAMMNVNMVALTELTHLFLPDIKKSSQGRIMNLASTAAFLPGPHMSVYYATKHYVLAFSEALAEELKSSKVTITALCPGATSSGFQAAAGMQQSKLVKDKSLPTAANIAEYGFTAMLKGKRVAIPGYDNKLIALLPRIMPRALLAKFVNEASKA